MSMSIITSHPSILGVLINLLELYCCLIFWTVNFRRREHSFLRKLLCIPVLAAGIAPLTFFRMHYDNAFVSMISFFGMYVLLFLCLAIIFDEPISRFLITCCNTAATQVIVARLYELLMVAFGADPMSELIPFSGAFFHTVAGQLAAFIIFFGIRLLLSGILAFIFRSRHPENTLINRYVLVFSVLFLLITIPVNAFSRYAEGVNTSLDVIVRIYAAAYALMTLFVQAGFLEQSYMQSELDTITEIMENEQKQFEYLKTDMDMINLKTHDLKHQLDQFEGRITDEELASLKEAITLYDSNLITGNKVLDTILNKKQMVCEKENIRLTCIADTSCLEDFTSTHLYSLLNNAIENAIEAVRKLDDPNQRIISIVIEQENGLNTLHFTNFYKEEPKITENGAVTSKADKLHHGLGLKSIQYITEQYEGEMNYYTDHGIFYLNLYFPG